MRPTTTVLILPSVAEATKLHLAVMKGMYEIIEMKLKERYDCSVITFTPVWMNLESFLGKILKWRNIKLPIF